MTNMVSPGGPILSMEVSQYIFAESFNSKRTKMVSPEKLVSGFHIDLILHRNCLKSCKPLKSA
jgi:hypothetical protein